MSCHTYHVICSLDCFCVGIRSNPRSRSRHDSVRLWCNMCEFCCRRVVMFVVVSCLYAFPIMLSYLISSHLILILSQWRKMQTCALTSLAAQSVQQQQRMQSCLMLHCNASHHSMSACNCSLESLMWHSLHVHFNRGSWWWFPESWPCHVIAHVSHLLQFYSPILIRRLASINHQ